MVWVGGVGVCCVCGVCCVYGVCVCVGIYMCVCARTQTHKINGRNSAVKFGTNCEPYIRKQK
jgi:hypothetical protein